MKKKRSYFSLVYGAANPRVVKVTSMALRNAIGNIESRQLEEKRNLPAICWAADFEDGKRHKESAKWNGLAYIDIDHVRANWSGSKDEYIDLLNTKEFYDALFGGREEDLHIVHAQISPSLDGLHIVFVPDVVPDKERGIEAAQAKFAEKAGLAFWDKSCHDLSRLLFLTPTVCTMFDITDLCYDD